MLEPVILQTLIWALAGTIIFFFGVFIGGAYVKSMARNGYLFMDGYYHTVRREL